MIDRASLRVVLRTLGRHKGFTTVAILSLAIAIALNTTMYSVLDAMFAPHISARRPENLYSLRYFGDYRGKLSPGAVEQALSARVRGFEGVSGYWNAGFLLGELAESGTSFRRVRPAAVRADLFDLLGTPAIQGRTFQARDEGEASTAVISDWLAEQLFPNESPIGRSLTLGGQDYAIIGIVERNQRFDPLSYDLWVLRPAAWKYSPITLIRYRDKVDVRIAYEELKTIAAQLALAADEKPGDSRFHLVPFETKQFRLARLHWALIGAVVAVLLVACANLANLQLARGLARSRELALRSAVGASRRQLITHLLSESGVLAVAGLTLGFVLALWGMHISKSTIPSVMAEYIIQPQMSWRVLAFAALAAVLCLFLVGLLPALHVSRVDPGSLLKSGAGTGANKHHRRRYGVMIVAQVGFALPVLIGAIVLLRSALILADPTYMSRFGFGYDPTPIVSARVAVGDKGTATRDLAAELTSRARSVQGVVDAAVYQIAQPLRRTVSVDGLDGAVRELPANQWGYSVVSPSYFRTLGQTIKYGRDFADGEIDGRSVIIDQSTSAFLFGHESAIGRAIKFGNANSDAPWLRIVGVLDDRRDSVQVAEYYMYGKSLASVHRVIGPSDSVGRTPRESFLFMYARANIATEIAASRLSRTLKSRDAARMAYIVPLTERFGFEQRRTQQNFLAGLFGTFGFVGLGLVAIGVYGIVSHSVTERRRELAVRISLGATARNILHAVLREGNALILTGLAMGLLFTKYTIVWLGRFIGTEWGPYDSPLFAAISAFLFIVAATSAFVPARRATLIDPVEALRHE